MKWKSKSFYEHPGNKEEVGEIVLNKRYIYSLRTKEGYVSCPQEWAKEMHKKEIEKKSRKKIGRPSVGDMILPGIKIGEKTYQGLNLKAKQSGISLANLRREAYRNIIR